MSILTLDAWERFTAGHPQAHVLQSAAWGALKRTFGWRPVPVVHGGSGALVLFRRALPGVSVGYVPKGPLGEDWAGLWPEIHAACRREGAVFLKVEPDAWEPLDQKRRAQMNGFVEGAATIQPRRTLVVDLSGSEADILGRMKQKTRYNIKLAEKKGVVVRQSEDVGAFNRLMAVTGARDDFGVHTPAYYQKAFDCFPVQERALLLAEYEGQPLAGVMVFAHGERSWYFYGASSDEERNRMPTYLVQWEAMRWARSHGCTTYDLWGVPDEEEEVLEAQFEHRSVGLWGVYRFKRGFGGKLQRAASAWEHVYHPTLYRLYQWWTGRRQAGGEAQ